MKKFDVVIEIEAEDDGVEQVSMAVSHCFHEELGSTLHVKSLRVEELSE